MSTRRAHLSRERCASGNAAPAALTGFLHSLAKQQGSTAPLVRIQTLGAANGEIVNGSATLEIALLTFLTVFWITFAALAIAAFLRRRLRERDTVPYFDSRPPTPS